MNVGQLKKLLEFHGDGLPVYMSSDPEGNSFNDLEIVERSFVRVDKYDIDVLHPDDADGSEDEALVLWP